MSFSRVTFICGRAGVCALGAVVAKHTGDERLLNYYLRKFEEVYFVVFISDPSNLYMKSSCLIGLYICVISLRTDQCTS